MFAARTKHLITTACVAWLAGFLLSVVPVAQAQQDRAAAQNTLKEVQLATDRFERGAPVPAWVERVGVLPEAQAKGSVVIRLADTQFMMNAQQSTYIHRAWAVNDTSALAQLGQYPIVFAANYQQIRLHTLRILRNNATLDQTRTANIRFLQREANLEQGMYNGFVTASILIDDLRVGDTLEIAYTMEGVNPVMGGKFSDLASWDYSVPTELRRVTLLAPVDRSIQWRSLGDMTTTIGAPVETVANGLRKRVWEERAMAAVEYEPYVPAAFDAARVLQLSDFSSWGEVSDWAVQLFKSDDAPLPPELQQVAQRLRARATPEERASGALSWVQSEIRYFSVALGESSHRPHPPSETLTRRYGDCKDKSFLLIELLRSLGLQAQPVLVSTRTRVGPAKMLPSPYAFDHAIVRVQIGDKAYFLDPTRQGQAGKLDSMGQAHENAEVLVIRPGNNSLSRITSANLADITRSEFHEKLGVSKLGGDGTLEVRRVWSGLSAEGSRLAVQRMPKEPFEKALLEPYENRYPGIQRAADSVIEDDANTNVLTLVSKYTIPNVAIQSGGNWGVRYGASNMVGSLRTPPSATRTQPMELPYMPSALQYNLEVEFPAEVSVVSDPVSRSVRDPAFEYITNTTFRGNRASASITLRTLQQQVEPKNTLAYMEALRQLGNLASPYFIVRRDDIKSTGLLGLGVKSLQQTIQDRLTDRIAKISKTIDTGKLQGEDLADAYCDRADAQSDLGHYALALKEAQLAVKTAPNHFTAYNCRASAWFVLGDYARSIADYSKSITLNATETSAHYHRGVSRFYAGQMDAALTDFTKARDPQAADVDGALYAELWRVWTQMRLGLAPDAEQVKLASANPLGDWPRPALAMLHGLLPVQDMLKQLDAKQGDDREMALAEAYFYIGQYHLLHGDKDKAVTYFRKTRDQGITLYMEHVCAGKELQQLGVPP